MEYLIYQQQSTPDRKIWSGFFTVKTGQTAGVLHQMIGGCPSLEAVTCSTTEAIVQSLPDEGRIGKPYQRGVRPIDDAQTISLQENKEEKDDNITWGVRPSQSNMVRIGKMLAAPGSIPVVMEMFPHLYSKHSNVIHEIRNSFIKSRTSKDVQDIRLYIGSPGSGKSSAVWDEFEPENVFQVRTFADNWEGYDGQSLILFDDWVGSSGFHPAEFMSVLDRHPMKVFSKHGPVNLAKCTIIIVSSVHWKHWYATSYFSDWAKWVGTFEKRITDFRVFSKGIALRGMDPRTFKDEDFYNSTIPMKFPIAVNPVVPKWPGWASDIDHDNVLLRCGEVDLEMGFSLPPLPSGTNEDDLDLSAYLNHHYPSPTPS